MKKIQAIVIFVIFLFVLPIIGRGQSIWSNAITGANPNTADPYTAGQTSDAFISVSGIGRGAGITGTNAMDRYNASGWNSATLNPVDYFTFTLTPNDGNKVDLASFVYTAQASASGPVSFSLKSSADNFTADIGSPTQAGTTVLLSAAAFQGITSPIEFRLYGWNAAAPGGTFSINDFTFNGAVTINSAPFSSAGDYFRSNVVTGDWATPASWQSSATGGASWITATLAPTNAAKAVNIRSGNSITLTTAIISKDLTIEQGGRLTNTNVLGGYLLTIEDDPLAAEDFVIAGTYELFGTSPVLLPGATAAVYGTGTVEVLNDFGGGSDKFARDTNVYFLNDAVFDWSASTAFSFSNVIYFPTAVAGVVPVFRVSTNPGTPGGGTAATINGIFEVNADVTLIGGAAKFFRDGIRGTATLTQNTTSGNSFNLTAATATLDGASLKIVLNTPLNLSSGTEIPSGASVTISGGNINNVAGAIVVNGTLDITDVSITNTSGSVTVNGTIRTANTGGFSGSGSIPSGTVILNITSAVVEYYAAVDQIVTSRADYYNLTLSGSGIKNPSGAFDPAGTVLITGNAIFDCTGNNIGNSFTSLTMTGGRLIVSTDGTQPSMANAYNLTGGVVEFKGAGTETIRSEIYQNIEVTGIGVGNSTGNITLAGFGTFSVKNGGVFSINDNTITGPAGTQTITVDDGGTFNSGNSKGFHGFTATFTDNSSIDSDIESIVLSAGSTVNYSRDNDQPITNANGLIYQNLAISGAAGIKTAPPDMLIIQGDLLKSGASTFDNGGGTVLLNGGDQFFAGLSYNNLLLDNAGTKTLTGNAEIIVSITLSNLLTTPATVLFLGENYINLRSTATSTARVGIIPTGAGVNITYGINGRFVIERYFPPRRSWRLITAPITADATKGNTVFTAWQNNGTASVLNGTYVTGKNPSPVNGLDISPLNNSSLKIYSGANFVEVGNTKNLVLSGTAGVQGVPDNFGMFLFVRGDRSGAGLFNPPYCNATTLRDTGKIQIDAQTFTLNAPINGFDIVGNPYACPVDITNIMASAVNVNPLYFYAYDPYLNIDQGGYVTMSNIGGLWIATPQRPGGQDKNIQSGQAFFVQKNSSAPGALIFNESDKSPQNNPGVFRPFSAAVTFSINLYLDEDDSSKVLADGSLVIFDSAANVNAKQSGALKFGNTKETLSLLSGTKLMAVERRALITTTDTLFLKLTKTTRRNYQFEFVPQNVSPLLSAFLEDNYTGIKTQVSLSVASTFSFNIDADTGTAAAQRFRVVFYSSGVPLAMHFKAVTATRLNNKIEVAWAVEDEQGIRGYEIEKSVDGEHFATIHTTPATGAFNTVQYKWPDEHAVSRE